MSWACPKYLVPNLHSRATQKVVVLLHNWQYTIANGVTEICIFEKLLCEYPGNEDKWNSIWKWHVSSHKLRFPSLLFRGDLITYYMRTTIFNFLWVFLSTVKDILETIFLGLPRQIYEGIHLFLAQIADM